MFRLVKRLLLLGALPLFLATASSAAAQEKAKAKGKEPTVSVAATVTFSAAERQRIVGWFADHRVEGAKPIPPGIRKNLARGTPLPPGIAKQVLPEGLAAGHPVRAGYERIQVGLDVLLVEIATGIIHDVLMDVIR